MHIIAFSLRAVVAFSTLSILSACNGDDYSGGATNATSDKLSLQAFHIPQNGKLAERQVVDYIAIRKNIIRDVKTKKQARQNYLAQHRKDPPSGPDFPTYDEIEKSAANASGMSYEEYLWIKDTVISTQTTILVRHYYDLNNQIITLLDKTLTHYKENNTKELEQQERNKMQGYVREMKEEMAALRGNLSDAVETPQAQQHNIAIITKYKKDLDDLQQQALN